MIDWLTEWLTDGLTDWLTNWLTDWLQLFLQCSVQLSKYAMVGVIFSLVYYYCWWKYDIGSEYSNDYNAASIFIYFIATWETFTAQIIEGLLQINNEFHLFWTILYDQWPWSKWWVKPQPPAMVKTITSLHSSDKIAFVILL